MPGSLKEHPIFGFDAPASADRWVFHYTSLKSARAIASSGTFRFNSLRSMNDPREFKQLALPVMSAGASLTKKQLHATEKLINRRRLAMRLGAFTRDDAAGSGSSLLRADSRGYAHPMMWTHYGGMHRGICLVFERLALEHALRHKFGADLLVGDVTYAVSTTQPAWTPTLAAPEVHKYGEAVAAQRFFDANKNDLMFIKNQDWSVEREWRVAIDNQPARGVVDIPIKSGVVAGIVLGMNVTKAQLTAVQAIGGAFGIADHVARAYLHQVNVIDVLPVDTSATTWRYYTVTELRGLGYL